MSDGCRTIQGHDAVFVRIRQSEEVRFRPSFLCRQAVLTRSRPEPGAPVAEESVAPPRIFLSPSSEGSRGRIRHSGKTNMTRRVGPFQLPTPPARGPVRSASPSRGCRQTSRAASGTAHVHATRCTWALSIRHGLCGYRPGSLLANAEGWSRRWPRTIIPRAALMGLRLVVRTTGQGFWLGAAIMLPWPGAVEGQYWVSAASGSVLSLSWAVAPAARGPRWRWPKTASIPWRPGPLFTPRRRSSSNGGRSCGATWCGRVSASRCRMPGWGRAVGRRGDRQVPRLILDALRAHHIDRGVLPLLTSVLSWVPTIPCGDRLHSPASFGPALSVMRDGGPPSAPASSPLILLSPRRLGPAGRVPLWPDSYLVEVRGVPRLMRSAPPEYDANRLWHYLAPRRPGRSCPASGKSSTLLPS